MAYETEVERGSTGITDAAPTFGTRPVAAGKTVSPHRLLEGVTGGTCQHAAVNSSDVIGANRENQIYAAGELVPLGYDRCTVPADQAVAELQWIKSYGAGRVGPAVTSDLTGDLLADDATGVAFTNQPANDGVEIVSDSAADTTQVITLYYTRNALGDTVFKASKTLTGTSQVSLTHTDVQLVLGATLSAAAAGTVTVREASGNATIVAFTAGQTSKGLVTPTATRAYNQAPTVVASDTTTKQIGLIGTDSTGAELLDSQALNGATAVTMNQVFNTVTFVLVGDLEATRTVDVQIGAQDTGDVIVGRALEAATAQDQLIDVFLTHFVGAGAVDATAFDELLGVTPGTVSASKVVIPDSNKDIADFRNLSATNLKAGKDAAAGTVTIFPTTTAKGKAVFDVTDQTGNTQVTHRTAAMGQATVITTPDPGASAASVVLTEGAQTINGNKTFGNSVIRASQEYCLGGPPKVGATSGWVVNGAADFFEATLPQSQTGSTLIVPIFGLKSGWTVTGFRVLAQVESAGNGVTIDGDLRFQQNAAADPTDNSVGTMTQVSVTADTAVSQTKTGLSHVVAVTNSYYLKITATTGATTDIRYLGVWVTVTEA